MRRWLSFLLSIGILAAAGWVAWRLAVQPQDRRPGGPPVAPPGQGPGPATRPSETRPETRISPKSAEDGKPLATNDRLEGTIYDENSRPVADAVVQIISFSYVSTSTRPLDRRFEDRTHAEVVTGDDGRFVFIGLVPGELKIVRVSKPGFVTQMKDGLRVPARRDFNMVSGARVTGRVVETATGNAVQGVGIKGWFPATTEPELAAKAFRWKEEVFTNAQGEYVFEGAPAGLVKFMLTHPEYEDVVEDHRVRQESSNVIGFRMRPALVIEGVVLDRKKGAPAADLEVAAVEATPLPMPARWKARTDEKGRFRMAGVRSGPIRFDLSGRGFNPAREVRELSEENDFIGGRKGKALEFHVDPAGRAAGKVKTITGEPVVRARVFVAPMTGIFVNVRDPALHGGSTADGETRTDEKGEFLVDDITPLAHRLVVEAPGFALEASEGFEVASDEIKEGIEVVLHPAPTIRGFVTEDGRQPIGGAAISVEVPQFGLATFMPGSELGQKSGRTGESDPGGGYRIEVPYAGKYLVKVDHPDYVAVEPVEVVLEAGQGEVTRDFSLKKALGITGVVTGPNGQPEAGAAVKAWTLPGGVASGEAKTDAAGAYALPRLQAGALYRIGARKAESELTAPFRDEVPAGSSGINFQLIPGGEIVGSVADRGGAPVTQFQVILRPVGERFGPRGNERKRITAGLTEREETIRDDGGIFRIGKVDPGIWSVQVLSPAHAPAAPVELTVPGGGPVSAGTIVVTPGGSVAGRITGPAGDAAAGVGVTLTRVGKLPEQEEPKPIVPKPWSGRTGADGDYAAKGLLPGEYLVRIESPRFVEPPQERVLVREGEAVEKSYKLRLAASLIVVVKDEVREPVPAAVILVTDSNQRRIFVQSEGVGGGSTDGSGRVVLTKLPAGEALTFRGVRAGFFGPDKTITLNEGENGPVDLKLERAH
jgi:Carboxypeptidase regulatory-like domain